LLRNQVAPAEKNLSTGNGRVHHGLSRLIFISPASDIYRLTN
jgi:hypothetical protein